MKMVPMGSSPRLVSISTFATLVLAVLLTLLPHRGNAQLNSSQFALDPVKNFCSRWDSSSIIRDNVIYIDGGVQKYNGTDQHPPIIGMNNYIITIPLNTTWDWKTSIKIFSEPKNVPNPKTGTTPLSLVRGTMFHGPSNSSQIFQYGGTVYMGNQSAPQYVAPDASTYALWSYDTETDGYRWDQYDISQPWMPNHGLSAEAVDMGYAFYLNGQIDWGTSALTQKFQNVSLYTPLEGMLIINLVEKTSVNISTPGLKSGPRVGGKMQYVDNVGEDGILVAIGGQVGDRPVYANSSKGTMLNLSTIDVFDINSYLKDPDSNGSWYQQTTTGDVPAPRIDFCLSYAAAPDNSSYHIYLYGGYNPTLSPNLNNTGYDDVYVLSLPSFHWTQVFTNGATPRWGHDCHMAGNRQMITLGGNITTLTCDWEAKGIAVLDMSTITWGSVFQADAPPYQVPQKVVSTIGGTVNGSATMKQPKNGWDDPQLATVFNTTRKWGPDPTPPPAPKKSTNVGAIAGGVVGGVVAVALIAGLLFFFRRKRNLSNQTGPSELENSEAFPREELESPGEKKKPGLPMEPAELPGPEAAELHAPREAVEADPHTATYAAELPGTNVVPWGKHGIPFVRTPGDELPESPEIYPGLRPPGESKKEQVEEDVKEVVVTPEQEKPQDEKPSLDEKSGEKK